jgi:hypothetical protein
MRHCEPNAGMIVAVEQAPSISIGGIKIPYPAPSSQAVSTIMRSNRCSDTALEVRVRSELHRRGARFRKQHLIAADGVRARADIAFPRKKLAVFLDGASGTAARFMATRQERTLATGRRNSTAMSSVTRGSPRLCSPAGGGFFASGSTFLQKKLPVM